jgi:hypothetical protein
MSEASFDRVISEHLALSKRNKRLEQRMPLDHYRECVEGGSMMKVSSSPSGKDEPAAETVANGRRERWLDAESFWDTTGERPLPEFDWGDD